MTSKACGGLTVWLTAPWVLRGNNRGFERKNEFCFGLVEFEVGVECIGSMDLCLGCGSQSIYFPCLGGLRLLLTVREGSRAVSGV